MNIPVFANERHESLEFKLAISKDGSLEAATRRASLFGRLIDENKNQTFRTTTKDVIVHEFVSQV